MGERSHQESEPEGPPSVRNVMSGSPAGHVVQAGSIGSITFAAPPPPSAVPRQVPPPAGNLVDRGDEIGLMRDLVRRPREVRPAVLVVRGMPGVGKSTLLRWGAAELAEQFPDGSLHADFGPLGHRGRAAVSEVAAEWLRSLGVPDLWIPADFAGRCDLLRSMTASRRLITVFDNVTDGAQVSALLPNSPTSLVLAASNRDLEELVLDGAEPVTLRPLEPEDALRLLAEMCPDGRIAKEIGQARELAGLCGHLPLALRVVGARLALRPHWTMARLVGELSDATRALDELSTAGRQVVLAVFDVAYHDLPEQTAEVYRFLGLLVGPHFGVEVVAALCDLPVPAARRELDDLCRMSLVEERADGRFELHRLVHLHALRMGEQTDTEAGRTAALRRALAWWLMGAVAADVAVTGPVRLRTVDPSTVLGTASPAIPRDAALDWLDNEHANIVGLMRAAADRGWHDEVCQLFEALFAYYDTRRPLTEWVEAGEMAVESARQCQHAAAEPRARCLLAKAFQEREQYAEAHAQLEIARPLAARLDDGERMLASTLDFSGNVHLRQQEYDAALAYFQQALSINERLRDIRGMALLSLFVGRAMGKLGRVDEAVAALGRARALIESSGDEPVLARIMLSTARVYVDAARDGAAEALNATLRLASRLSMTALEADALELRAALARRHGDEATEAECRRLAADAYAKMGSPRAARLHAHLVERR